MAERAQTVLRRATVIANEGAKLLERAGISQSPTIMAEKRGVGTLSDGDCGQAPVRTNAYGLLMRPMSVYRYDVTIMAELRNGRAIEITKKVSKDTLLVDRRLMAREVFTTFKAEYADFLQMKDNYVYYDLQSLLYSVLPLKIDRQQSFRIASSKMVNVASLPADVYIVTIKCVTGKSETVKLADLSHITNNMQNVDKSLEQFLNLATSQNVLFNKEDFVSFSSSSIYHLQPEKYGFKPADLPFFEDNGSYLAIGIEKGVHPMEGPRGGAALGLVISTKKTPFHCVETVLQKVCRFVTNANNVYNNTLVNGDHKRISQELKGIVVETTYGIRKRKFTIAELSLESAATKRFPIMESNNGGSERMITVQEYFSQKYDITLKYPNASVISAARQQGSNFFPMELCLVCDNQRVRVQGRDQIKEMIKHCAVPPLRRIEQNLQSMKALALEEDEGMSMAKVRFVPTQLTAASRHLPPPVIEYRDAYTTAVRRDNFTWSGRHFLVSGTCEIWAVYVFGSRQIRDNVSESEFRRFIERFMEEALRFGLSFPIPADVRFCACNEDELKNEFKLAADHGCKFMLMVHPDKNDDFHPAIKYYERLFGIVTQGLNMGTVRTIVAKGQPQTLQNILNKTNVKLGGCNYSLCFKDDAISKELLGTKTLYIGFGMNHPPPGEQMTNGVTPNGNGNGNGSNGNGSDGSGSSQFIPPNTTPSVVGYAANTGVNNVFEFIGDFIYQESKRDEKMSIIRLIVKRCVEAYRRNRKADPERVIIYRNGCTDGQYESILKFEIPLVRHELSTLGCRAGVTVIVSNKRQNIRFFKDKINSADKPPEQNIRPGTVVDSCVVHPMFCEFYLNAHRAIQGTARTPRYTLLYDDNKLSMDMLQGMTNHLCYGHQIVNLPTSLPSPVYIAIRYAERGQMLYHKMRDVMSTDSEPRTYDELTGRLGLSAVEAFRDRRINA